MSQDPNYSREESISRNLSAARMALKCIASYGDCYRINEGDEDGPCDCPICMAKTALQSGGEWRFQGNHYHRCQRNPREAAIINAWERYMSGSVDGTGSADNKLCQIIGFEEVTTRDWLVATGIIQWVTTNIGSCLLGEAGYKYDPPKPRKEK